MSAEEKKKPNLLQRGLQELRDFADWSMRTLGDRKVREAVFADAGIPIKKKPEGEDPDKEPPLDFPQADAHFAGIDEYLKTVNPNREAFIARLADAKAGIRVIKDVVGAVQTEAKAAHVSDAIFQVLALNFLFRRWPVIYWLGQPFGFFADLAQTDPLLEKFGDGIVGFFKDKPSGTRLRDDWLSSVAVGIAAALEISHAKNVHLLYGWEPGPNSPTPIADALAQRALSVAVDLKKGSALSGTLTITMVYVPVGVGEPGTLISIAGDGLFQEELVPGWLLKIEVRGGQVFDVYLPENGDPQVHGPEDARLSLTWESKPDPNGVPTVLPIRGGTRLEFNKALASVAISRAGFEARLATEKAVFILESGDDPLLKRGLKSGSLRTEFDLGLGYANGKPFIEGGATLQATVPAMKVLGPVDVKSVTLGLRTGEKPEEPDLRFEASVTVVVKIGPVAMTLDRVGCAVKLDFGRGENKEADADIDFQPPLGVGLSIATDTVEGGGYIFRDAQLDQYAGVIQLKIAKKIDVKAIALLTKTINGQPAFSLLLIVSAEGFRAIPLGLGFKLTGIGGIFGLDRTINVPVLEAGVKNNALDALLFPNDPIKNAAKIVATAGAVFPPMLDRCVFGPMVRITWGADQHVVIDLAVLLEFGSTLKRIAILGKARTHFPKPDKAVVKLEIDLVGTIDLDAKRAFAHAVITVGELGAFKLSGEAAMLYTWGARPFFVLSIGGFNPRYQKPENFPALERVKFSLAKKESLTVDATFYVAVTSNSFQIGGSLNLVAKKSKFTLKGGITIDALIQSQQPAYAFDLSASLELQVWGTPLFAVRLKGTLLGDRPWSISGKATFEIWIFDYTVDFSHTWGSRDGAQPAAPAIEVRPEVIAALADRRNWTVELPAGTRSPVTLRRLADSETHLHPLGAITVTQRVVPFDVPLARVGQSRVRGQSLYRIERLSIAGTAVATQPISEPFAPSQFVDMTDDQKLGSPSFENMQAGVRSLAAPITQGAAVDTPADYLTSVYNPKTRRAEPLQPPGGLGLHVRPVLRRGVVLNAKTVPTPKAIRLGSFTWTLASIDTLQPATNTPTGSPPTSTFTASFAKLHAPSTRRAQLQLIAAAPKP